MRLPMQGGAIDEPRAVAQIRSAIDRGVNYVDTAWPYHGGESEPLLGKALRDGYRDEVRLATKLPSWLIKSREDMDRYLAEQLRRLGTDRIDYYLVHALNGPIWDKLAGLGVMEFLDQARRDGRIGNAGFSFHGLLPDFKRIIDAYPWVFCQIQYNYLDREHQAGLEGLRYAAARDIGVIIMEPLRGDSLALPTPPPAVAAIWNEAPTRRSPAEWGLRWLWNHPEVTVVLSGMNDEAQVAENLSIADSGQSNSLSAEELALVDRADRTYKKLMQVGCTGCGYCMPCPSGVMIPSCFEEFNKMHLFGNPEEAKFYYAMRLSGDLADGAAGYASQCVECGECMAKCPQQLRIPEFLARVAEEMEDAHMAERLATARKLFRKGLD
jgi:predicted aldo/keto reductase-like oxidoreductase